jgi:hypothetical protein
MGVNSSRVFVNNKIFDYTGAGCMFVSDKSVLAGYQPNKKNPMISGFGGKRKTGESFMDTALRETFEELFDIEIVPNILIKKVTENIPPRLIRTYGSYITLIYTLSDLDDILFLARQHIGCSELYPISFPRNYIELMYYRINNGDCEVSHIFLLPYVKNVSIDPLLVGDINECVKNLKYKDARFFSLRI